MKNSKDKSKRLSEALRANLKRRKQEARALGDMTRDSANDGEKAADTSKAPALRKHPLKTRDAE